MPAKRHFFAHAPAALLLLCAPACLASGTFTVLHNFTNTPDGAAPGRNVVLDRSGSLFGVAQIGGANGYGCVFELTPPAFGQSGWTETILHSFGKATGPQGANPFLITLGAPGHLFVVTTRYKVGRYSHSVMLELSRHGSIWTPQLVHSFGSGSDGDGIPNVSPLLIDNTGAIFGETHLGGNSDSGSVFKLTPPVSGSTTWTEQLIWNFGNGSDFYPDGQLVFDPAGNLYGTSEFGGPNFAGAVWELSPPAAGSSDWTRTVLYNFPGPADPFGSLLRDAAGNLYGETQLDKSAMWELSPPASGGTTWTETSVYSFRSLLDKVYGFAFDHYGNVVGAAGKSLFELQPPSAGQTSWTMHVLWSFGRHPVVPGTPLIARGNRIFGTIAATNHSNLGLVFEYKH